MPPTFLPFFQVIFLHHTSYLFSRNLSHLSPPCPLSVPACLFFFFFFLPTADQHAFFNSFALYTFLSMHFTLFYLRTIAHPLLSTKDLMVHCQRSRYLLSFKGKGSWHPPLRISVVMNWVTLNTLPDYLISAFLSWCKKKKSSLGFHYFISLEPH